MVERPAWLDGCWVLGGDDVLAGAEDPLLMAGVAGSPLSFVGWWKQQTSVARPCPMPVTVLATLFSSPLLAA